jgi:RNA polymerase subunit RPABC4/transcription elongation factor Spt4
MSKNAQEVWTDDSKVGVPPAHKEFILGYENPEKVLLSFKFDGSEFGTYLDLDRPIVINGKNVPIPDFPQSKLALKQIEMNEVDVTKFVRTGPKREKNLIEVNYVVPPLVTPKIYMKGYAGKLTLYFTIVLPAPKSETEDVRTTKTKFCWFCGKAIPSDSRVCPYCAQHLDIPMGTNPKVCRNCSASLPAGAIYCDVCGKIQPQA